MLHQDRLADVLSEFARTLATDFPIQGILDHLVHRIVDVLPVDAAGVTLISPIGNPRFIASSDESALCYEKLQTELGEGPCLAAYATNAPIAIPDLAHDDAFPRFSARALEEGLVAVFTFPLRDGDQGLGALDLYRHTAGPLDAEEMIAAQTLADVATAYLLNAQARVDLESVSATEREALDRLRVVDRTKTEYLATVIHELRTPMTSITGYTEMLQDGDGGDLSATQQRLVEAIDRNSDRLTALADDLLTLASLEGGAPLEEYTKLDLDEVIQAARTSLQALIEGRRVECTFEMPMTPVLVYGNARQLERLVSNLLTNALKFTHPGGWVRCALSTDNGTAHLEVSDNGIGIPEAEQAHLFTRFFRSSTSQYHAIPGSGLGLNIIESIAHNHGGKVSVVSAHHRGSTFTVDLPLQSQNGTSTTTPGEAAERATQRDFGWPLESDAAFLGTHDPASADEFEVAINRVDDAVFALDRDWHVRFINLAGARLLGREVRDLLGKNVRSEFPSAVGSEFDLRYREALKTQKRVEFEEYFPALRAWFAVRVYPSADGVTLILRDVTKLRALTEERRGFVGRLLEAEDRERARIAADVHDDSLQALGVINLQLHVLRHHLPAPPPTVASLLDSLSEQVVVAADRLRALLFTLEPMEADAPINQSIRTQAAHIFDNSSIHWSVDDLDAGEELARAERSQALRIIKEALLNVQEHSQASEVTVTLLGDEQGLQVHIADDGITVDPSSFASAAGHRGLATMHDRAAVVGGWFKLEPAAPHGCIVRFYVPRDRPS